MSDDGDGGTNPPGRADPGGGPVPEPRSILPVDERAALPVDERGAYPPAPDVTGSPGGEGRRGLAAIGESWRSVLWLGLLFLVLATSLSVLSQMRDDRYSMLDETTHADWVYRAGLLDFPATGSSIDPEIMRDLGCRGQVNLGPDILPPCDPAVGGNGKHPGKQYNPLHPPLYYTVTGVVAHGLDAVLPFGNVVSIARTLGAVWLALGMLAFYLSLRYWRLDRVLAVTATLLLLTIPVILHAARIVTNDAPSVLGGAAAVFVLGRVMLYQRTGWVLPAVLTLLLTATKVTNGVPLVGVGMVLGAAGLVNWVRGRREQGPRWVWIGLGIGAMTLLVQLGWTWIQGRRAVGPPSYPRKLPTEPTYQGSTPFDEWLLEITRSLRVTGGYYMHPSTTSVLQSVYTGLLTALVSAAAITVVVTFVKGTAARMLAWAMMAGGVAYVIEAELAMWSISNHNGYFVNLSPRYGMSLIPVAIALMALVVAVRPAFRKFSGTLVGVGGVIAVASLFGLLSFI